MTVLSALLLVLPPTGIGLALVGVADPKRRRSSGLGPLPWPCRPVGFALCLFCGIVVGLAAGVVGVLIWLSIAAPLGWAVTNSLAMLTPSVAAEPGLIDERHRRPVGAESAGLSGLAEHSKAFMARWTESAWPRVWARAVAHRVTLTVAATAFSAGVAILIASQVWGLLSGSAESLRRQVGLQAVGLFLSTDEDRKAGLACLGVLDETFGNEVALQEMLSGRSYVVTLDSHEGGDRIGVADLQRCLAGVGESQDLDGDRQTFIVDAMPAGRVKALIVAGLIAHERLAAVYIEDPRRSGFVCRQLVPWIDPVIYRFLDLLRENRHYAKAGDLLDRLPSLDRLTTDVSDSRACPA